METKNNNERRAGKDENSKVELRLSGLYLSKASKRLLGENSCGFLQASNSLDQLNSRQKYVLRELVRFTCQHCGNTEEDVGTLQPHRIIRKNQGGKYSPSNIKMCCNNCHKMMHQNEFR